MELLGRRLSFALGECSAAQAEKWTVCHDWGSSARSQAGGDPEFSPNKVDATLGSLTAALPELEGLSVRGTDLASLDQLGGFTHLEWLDCSATQISNLGPLVALRGLQTLDCSDTKIADLKAAAELTALQALRCWWTPISDLEPVKELSALQTLDCSWTQISDLGPLAALGALRTFNCSGTGISNLGPIAGLGSLQTLKCSWVEITDLIPVAGLSALQTLDCSWTQISALGPLAALGALRTLNCSGTGISNLGPIAGLGSLQTLDCSGTPISDLEPIGGLSGLQTLNFSRTQISSLRPIGGLSGLQTLDCSSTQITDLGPVADLSRLQSLDCSDVRLVSTPEALWHKPSLRRLALHGAHLPGVPAEVLSQSPGEDCLHSLRAHLGDLAEGGIAMPDVKVMVLGNGRVGKTQICRRLRGENYDEGVPSAHGIIVTSVQLPGSTGEKTAKLHIWDFGVQDVYHGTHALFMRASAIFQLVWTPERERFGEHFHDGERFRDYPLSYWLKHVRQLGGWAVLFCSFKLAANVRKTRQ